MKHDLNRTMDQRNKDYSYALFIAMPFPETQALKKGSQGLDGNGSISLDVFSVNSVSRLRFR